MTKTCPGCNAQVGKSAPICGLCGHRFSRAEPERPKVVTGTFDINPTPCGGAVLLWPKLDQRVTLDPHEWALVRLLAKST